MPVCFARAISAAKKRIPGELIVRVGVQGRPGRPRQVVNEEAKAMNERDLATMSPDERDAVAATLEEPEQGKFLALWQEAAVRTHGGRWLWDWLNRTR